MATDRDGLLICGRTTAEGPKVGYRVVLYHGHPCKRRVKNEGDRCWQHGGDTEVVRLSIPGHACVHCGAVMGEKLVCPGCGWADPETRRLGGEDHG